MDIDERDALYLLSAGTPTPTKLRFGTALVLQIGREFLLFDCGPATTYKLVRSDVWPTQIDYLFVTHHHFDHNADLPCFLLCRWDQSTGRERPLTLFGPPPTRTIVQKLIGPDGAFADDWKARVGDPASQRVHQNRGGTLPRPVPSVEVVEIDGGEVLQRAGWRVTAAQVPHAEPWLRSLAYRVDTDRGSIVLAGDTGPCPQLADFAKGTTVFVANCWNHQQTMDEDGEAPGQTGTLDAAKFARDSCATSLVLSHLGPALCLPGAQARATREIAAIYKGEIVFGAEGMVLNLWQGGDVARGGS